MVSSILCVGQTQRVPDKRQFCLALGLLSFIRPLCTWSVRVESEYWSCYSCRTHTTCGPSESRYGSRFVNGTISSTILIEGASLSLVSLCMSVFLSFCLAVCLPPSPPVSCINVYSLIHAPMYINDTCNFIFTYQ